MRKVQLFIIFILIPTLSFSQDLSGLWSGVGAQKFSKKVYNWHVEANIKQEEKKLSGKMAFVEYGTKNHFIVTFDGTIINDKVKIYSGKVVKIDYPNTNFDFLCFRNYKGELLVDNKNDSLIIDLASYGTSLLYHLLTKQYSEGNCTPSTLRLTKKNITTDNQSLASQDSIKQTNSYKNQIISIDKKEIKLFTKTIKIKVWDRYEEDDDIINLYLNGEIIFPNLKVTKKGEFLEIELISGINIIEVEAINEGNVSPNTSAVSIFTNNQQHDITLCAKKGERDSLKIILE